MSRSTIEIAHSHADFRPEYSFGDMWLVREQMVREMEKTGYNNLFTARTPDDDPLGTWRLDHPHIPAEETFNEAVFEHIGTLLDRDVILRKDRIKLTSVIDEQILEPCLPTLDQGENVAIVTDHMSYADLLLIMYCIADAKRRRGRNPTSNQHMILGRSVNLFAKPNLKLGRNGKPELGYMIDDVLRYLCGVLQTLPPDQGGVEISSELRTLIGLRFMTKYLSILEQTEGQTEGQIILAALSGIEDKRVRDENNDEVILMHRIQNSTKHLLSFPNKKQKVKQDDGSVIEKDGPGIKTLGFFLDLQLRDRLGNFCGPARASGKASSQLVVVNSLAEAQAVMEEIASLGNSGGKLDQTPPIMYQAKDEALAAAVIRRSGIIRV